MIKRELLKKIKSAEPSEPGTTWKWFLRIGIFAAAFCASVFILIYEYEPQTGAAVFRVGEPAPRSLFSPQTVTYINDQETEALRNKAVLAVAPVYILNRKIDQEISARIDSLFETIHAARSNPNVLVNLDPEKLAVKISSSSINFLLRDGAFEDARKGLEILLERTLPAGILSTEDRMNFLREGIQKILLIRQGEKEKTENFIYASEIRDEDEIRNSASLLLADTSGIKRELKEVVLEIFNAVIRPNVIYSPAETEVQKKKASDRIASVEETIHKDELIIQRGVLVAPKEKNKIDRVLKKTENSKILKKWSGVILLALLTYTIFILFLLFFERKILYSWRSILLFNAVILVSLLICKGIKVWPGSSPYLMPGALAPLLIALLAGNRFGLAVAFVMTGLLAPLTGFSPEIILTVLFSGIAGTLAAFRLRKRLEFFRVGLAVSGVIFLILFGFGLSHDSTFMDAAQLGTFGFINGFLITTPCLFLLLAVFESVFNLATDITLLELSDLNHPLLKRMIIEAPGTYHHSLVVSRLAEGACEVIGANALLARVGCYFHDIGKMVQSHYFTENQTGKYPSKHEKLTPAMSSLVIINHVKDGIELGRKYKLKESVIQFIPEHQGTAVVYYFYRKALEQARDGEVVNPEDYRYPGPNPQSKETAVAMLADSVEAASRSLRDHSFEHLNVLVKKIINDKFVDGQLNECDLTLKDLYKIQESFVRDLMAIFHTRIPYPEKPMDPEKTDLFAKIGQDKPPLKSRLHL